MSRSQTITDPDWLPNDHAGEMLFKEFLEPLALETAALAAAIGVPADRLTLVIDGKRPIDAELDLRLARYFAISDGFFLRLQNRYDLLEAKRALNGALERIIPRAA